MSFRLGRHVGLFAMLALLLTLQGCREEEQGRSLLDRKGVYEGEPDQALSAEQVDELRERARSQGF